LKRQNLKYFSCSAFSAASLFFSSDGRFFFSSRPLSKYSLIGVKSKSSSFYTSSLFLNRFMNAFLKFLSTISLSANSEPTI